LGDRGGRPRTQVNMNIFLFGDWQAADPTYPRIGQPRMEKAAGKPAAF
jgi:hypothetical protein